MALSSYFCNSTYPVIGLNSKLYPCLVILKLMGTDTYIQEPKKWSSRYQLYNITDEAGWERAPALQPNELPNAAHTP